MLLQCKWSFFSLLFFIFIKSETDVVRCTFLKNELFRTKIFFTKFQKTIFFRKTMSSKFRKRNQVFNNKPWKSVFWNARSLSHFSKIRGRCFLAFPILQLICITIFAKKFRNGEKCTWENKRPLTYLCVTIDSDYLSFWSKSKNIFDEIAELSALQHFSHLLA